MIAHRLATIRNAERVLVVTPNGIEEDGTYDELAAQNGLFAKLHHIQLRKGQGEVSKEQFVEINT